MINPALAHLFENWQLDIDAADDGTSATALFGDEAVEISVTAHGDDAEEALANLMSTINESASALACI
ncbi:hypothetical protein [Aerobium aerolatum]|uniref:Uncharacterized protein n=1 Tax=Aquamicrobium aerolatum DSM 21857 TaxID=1121003 RepID=A0A1I3JGL3_9HYPH|nr:hypothetical protein [Aquamicrobium aerolatum]SFI59296.1 hypothetical protein SAMN03080618_00845 [Aquamicrobium aerolatum DSM 21857]